MPVPEIEFFCTPPRADLAPFVEAVWGVRGPAEDVTEAVLPNGAIELMINFGPVQHVVGHGDRELLQSHRRAWLAGIQDRRLVHLSKTGVDHLSVRFRPGGAHAFFDLPMGEVANSVVELDQLIGTEADALRDRLGSASSDARRVDLMQDWLLARRHVHRGFPKVIDALELLGDPERPTSVAAICERVGLSNKHLVDQFRRLVGLPPKVMGRVLRFQRVIDACRGRDEVDWLDMVHGFGYADQSHLIREFRRLGNVTPSSFLASRSEDGTSVSIG